MQPEKHSTLATPESKGPRYGHTTAKGELQPDNTQWGFRSGPDSLIEEETEVVGEETEGMGV